MFPEPGRTRYFINEDYWTSIYNIEGEVWKIPEHWQEVTSLVEAKGDLEPHRIELFYEDVRGFERIKSPFPTPFISLN